ncbi:GyrI-like domain-containing protein [Paenibacillus sp. MWE-103]|uniref:GyrI-like domain-containing protein n=1 Tax=Paenibacillus artemisiicola TaxID=1172618 RepID=A0ABS3W3Q9_9BACL|nr:GyrI-like domain-containing protein [Paenibacillus artemisiicola]MBO7742923.1 GyrI-like domain-containing protein [Paenibacillus artemisiicola]
MRTYSVERVEMPAIRLIGFELHESLNQVLETKIVVKLREELAARLRDIEGAANAADIYLVQAYSENEQWTPDKPYRHVIGAAAAEGAAIPAGMIAYALPAGRYVKVTHEGPESRIGETYDYINRELGHRPVDIEVWPDIHALEREESRIDIYFPDRG